MKSMLLGEHLIKTGIITRDQLETALKIDREDRLIGEIALEENLLSPEALSKTIAYMEEAQNLRFGEAAINLGYLTSNQIRYLLGIKTRRKVRIGDILVREGFITGKVLYQKLMELDIENKRIKKILVCETTTTITRLLKRMLEECGYEVLTAKTGQEALKMAVQTKPDMLITSNELEDINGFKLCYRLAADPTTSKIISILITSNISNETIENAFNSGVTYTLRKPLNQKELMNIIYQVEMEESEKRPEKILIVDDSSVARMAIQRELSASWENIHMAQNGMEALMKAVEIMPDIITMDVEMPKMNGFEACRKLKEDPTTVNIPIVMITSKESAEARERGFEVGAVEYFTKPFKSGTLGSFIAMVFDSAGTRKSEKILIVDDSKITQHILRYFFMKNGYTVVIAENGQEALKLLEEKSLPDIIITDCEMPEMDGFRLTEKIKQRISLRHLPIIMLTASKTKLDVVKGFNAGVSDYIQKPFDESELLARIETHLKNKVLVESLKLEEEKLRKANEELKRISSLDGLTEIANRRHFDDFLGRECRRALREKTPISLILMDIDFFKKYNDNYGHQAGDDCLKKVAKTLADKFHRPGDLVARYGGEEFVVVLGSTDVKEAEFMAEMLCASIEEMKVPHAMSDVTDVVTLSLGVSCLTPPSDVSPEKLIRLADEALYKAKEEGRNRVTTSE